MSAHHFKLNSQEKEQTAAHEQSAQSQTSREFATPEELLRFDAAQTAVPPEVAARLQQSVEQDKLRPPSSWWRQLLGK